MCLRKGKENAPLRREGESALRQLIDARILTVPRRYTSLSVVLDRKRDVVGERWVTMDRRGTRKEDEPPRGTCDATFRETVRKWRVHVAVAITASGGC